jgi:predicted nucleic acid-binding protein
MKVLIDTGVFVNVLNKEKGFESSVRMLEKVRTQKLAGFISVMTIAEIVSIYRRLGEEETVVAKANMEALIGEDRIIPVTKGIAEAAGKIKAEYKMSLADALIVATSAMVGYDYLASLDPEIKQVDGKLVKIRDPKQL